MNKIKKYRKYIFLIISICCVAGVEISIQTSGIPQKIDRTRKSFYISIFDYHQNESSYVRAVDIDIASVCCGLVVGICSGKFWNSAYAPLAFPLSWPASYILREVIIDTVESILSSMKAELTEHQLWLDRHQAGDLMGRVARVSDWITYLWIVS